MKTLLITTIAAICVFNALSAPAGWLTDYQQALARARKEKKALLVLFTGSDWCPGCKTLAREVLDKKEFMEFAAKHLVPVYLDSPRGRELTAAERQQLITLNKQLRPGPYVPTTVIVGSDGKVKARIVGAFQLDNYIKQISGALK